MRRNYVYGKRKQNSELITVQNYPIIKIECQNMEINGKLKTVFYIPTYLCPEGKMCIAWERTNFNVGDIINMQGIIKGDVFLVYSYTFQKKSRK